MTLPHAVARLRWSVAALLLGLAAISPTRGDGPSRSSPAAKAAYTAAAALQNREAWDLAADGWEALLRDHPADPLAPKARYYLGLCRVAEGRWPAAAEAFRAVVADGSSDAETMALARFELGRGSFSAATAAGSPDAYRDAAEALSGFLRAAPRHPRASEAAFLLAEATWQSGDRDGAIANWERFLREHADSPRQPDVLYALGVAQAEVARAADAAVTLRRFAERYPRHPLAGEVAIRRSDLALAGGDPVEAAKLVVELAKGDGPRSAEALERLGTALGRQRRFAAAAAAFDLLAERFPDAPQSAAAVLQAATAWEQAGKVEEARARLERLVGSSAGRVDRATALEAAARLARLDLAADRPQAALEVVDRALAEDGSPPLVARLLLVRAEALLALPQRRDEAIAALDRLLAQQPATPSTPPALALRASALLDAGRWQDARSAADAYLGIPQEDRRTAGDDGRTTADVRAIRAETLLAGGDAGGAALAFGALVADAADDSSRLPRWRLRQGAALVAAGDWHQAHGVLGPLASAAPGAAGIAGEDLSAALLLDATALVESARPAEALPLLARLERDHAAWPRLPEARLLGVRARRDAGDLAGALGLAEALVAAGPPEGIAERAWFRLGQVRQEAGRHADAIVAFEESRRLAPGGPRAAAAWLAEGWCRDALGEPARAETCWGEVIQRFADSPQAVPALLARGDGRLLAGDPTAARADADRVIALAGAGDPRVGRGPLSEAMFLAGLCLGRSGDVAGEIAALRGLLAEDPGFAAADRVHLELGAALALAGDDAAAEATLADLRKRFPRSGRIAESWLESGEIHVAAGDFDAAAAAYREALAATRGADSDPLREQALHRLAWTASMRRDHPAAAEGFAAQLESFPDGPLAADGRAMLGDALFRLGRFQEGATVLAEALAAPERISSADLLAMATVRGAECAARLERWEESLRIVESWRGAGATPAGDAAAGAARALVAQARYSRAWALQNLGRLDEALVEYGSLAQEGLAEADDGRGADEIAARARLMEGEVLFEQQRHKEAIASFFKVAYGFGDKKAPPSFHPWQAQATFEAARCFEVLGKPEQARGLYAEVVERYPESPHVAASRKRIEALTPIAK